MANPDFPANSMIFGPSRAKAYQPCDPRYSSGLSDERMDSAIAEYQYKGDKSRELQIDECTIPTKYRRVQSHRGRDKMKQFQYQGYNVISITCVYFCSLIFISPCLDGRFCCWSGKLDPASMD